MAPVLRHCPCLRPESDDVRLLDYSHSNLDDVPSEVFGYERTLEELFLDANQIKDLPRPLFHCHGLRKLNLSDNEVQTLPPAIASLINLEHLDISKNGVLEIPENIKGCKCLTVIDASVNPLGKLPEGFTFLINLHELYLNDTFLEYLPANFGRLAHLRILELRENHLKLLPKSMARLVELGRLDIGQNDFAELPEVIGNLPRLVELWCDCNNLSCLPPFLGGLKKLAYLDASKNKIYEVAEEIEGCISLCDLTLSSNRIKVLPDGIANLRKLTVLRVDENRIVSVPDSIGNLCNLEELVLSSNNLKSLPPSLGLLRNLRTLIADDNLLEELPCEIGSCLKLTILSLRDNKLVHIPDELGHITALKVINLSGNLLQYLPFSIAKLPNLQALWLSENQNKPLIPLQSDTDRATGQKVLTCFMLPQVQLDEEVIEPDGIETDVPESAKGRHTIKFAFDAGKDQPSKLVRAPTPYPKELKAHARHARNYALKKQGSKDSEGNEVTTEDTQVLDRSSGLHATGATPDIMLLPTLPPKEGSTKVKEASVIKPKSPLSSPPKHERHYIPNVKDQSSQEINEIKPHAFLEQNPLQISHQVSSDIIGADMAAKILGRRDSRGDGSSSENTSTSATGSPKLTPDTILMDSCNHPLKMDKDGLFKKNIPQPGKRDTWMRQRLLKQGSGDSDRGYRSDHEVYLAEKDQYGQCYHDGYASDWEAFLAKQPYSGPSNPEAQHYARHSQGELDYRGHAEGQEIKPERDGFMVPWDSRFHYPSEGGAVLVNEEYQARMAQPYNAYWQMDPNSGQFYSVYDMSHSYPPTAENSPYGYARNSVAEAPPLPPPLPPHQPYYEDVDGYKHITPQFYMQHVPNPNPNPVICNTPGTAPRRLGAASPRLKRSQCLSVQAPLHGNPQEYHLIPHQPGTLRPNVPSTSPRPGRSPSPGVETRFQYSPQPYQKFPPPHFQPPCPPVQAYPITTQPVNLSHFPPPLTNMHPHYQNAPRGFQAHGYPTLPASPRVKPAAHQYPPSAMDDSALVSRPYPMVPQPNVHGSNYFGPNAQENVAYHHGFQMDDFGKVQDAEYGVVSPTSLHFRSGSIPAQMQNVEGPDIGGGQHLNRSVPSINIIPSTSPPRISYMTNVEGWRGDSSNATNAKQTSETTASSHSTDSNSFESSDSPNHRFNPNSAKSSDNTFKQELRSTEENTKAIEEKPPVNSVNDAASNKVVEKVTETHSPTSNSYTIIAPKPSKIVPPQDTSSVPNPVQNNKDFKLSSTLNEGQTGFKKPGCFQAVPVNIPSVHTAPRKKETVAIPKNETCTGTKNDNPCANTEECTAQVPMISSKTPTHMVPQSRQTNSPNPTSSETVKQSGYVGGMISNINKSLNTQDCNPPIEPRTTSLSPKPPQLEGNNLKNDYIKSEPPAKVVAKPGYPVKVIPNVGGKPDDCPPELPKKNKPPVAMRNMMTSTESKGAALLQQVSKNFPQEVHKSVPEKNPKTPDRHKSAFAESSQNKIVFENNKNAKITQHTANNPHSKQKVDNSAFSNDTKGNQIESSKSSDKRFQKVLPPIDTSFHLKPANLKKSSEQPSEDLKHNPETSRTDNNQTKAKTSAPALPAKINSSIRTDNSGPPTIPPKRSSMVVNMVPSDVSHNTPTDDSSQDRNVPRKRLEKTKSLSENDQVHYTNEMDKITKLQVDVVQAKEVNNEKNEQLQKGNMPDLISRIIPDEKNELIILEQNNKVLKSVKSEEDELSKDNFSFNKESEKDGLPESPKSPKRHSWFFGTHKNSLVFPVIVSRNPELGFSIEGGIGTPRNPCKPYDNGIYVAHVLDDGPASSLLRAGDKILQVDGKDFTQLDHNKAVAALQEGGATVSLMVSRQ